MLESGQYSSTPEGAKKLAASPKRKYGRRRPVAACETTANMWQVSYAAFEDAGIDIKLADTYRMVLVSRTSKKTDKIDAEKTAQVLRTGMLPECHAPDAGTMAQRQLIRRRVSLGQDRTRATNRLRALLDMHGRTVDALRLYLKKAMAQPSCMILGNGEDSADTAVLRSHVRQIASLNDGIGDVERRIDVEAAADEDAELLMSITGFDACSAIALSAEIDDISRFESPKHDVLKLGRLCAGLGGGRGERGADIQTCASIKRAADALLQKLDRAAQAEEGGPEPAAPEDGEGLSIAPDRTAYPIGGLVYVRTWLGPSRGGEVRYTVVNEPGKAVHESRAVPADHPGWGAVHKGVLDHRIRLEGRRWKAGRTYGVTASLGGSLATARFSIVKRAPIIESDNSVYMAGDDMIITVIDPDADKDSREVEYVGGGGDSKLVIESDDARSTATACVRREDRREYSRE